MPSCQIIPVTTRCPCSIQILLVMCFEMSPVLTPTQQQERKGLLWAPWQCDCEGNCLVFSWFACRPRAPESCLEEVCPIHSSTSSSKSKEVRFWTHLEPPILETGCPLLSYITKACTLKKRGSSCERSFRALGNASKSQTRSQWSLNFEDSWKNLISIVLLLSR